MAKISIVARSFCQSAALRSIALDKLCDHELSFFDGATIASGIQILDELKGAHGAIVGRETIDGSVLEKCPNLKVISLYGVGHDNISLDALQEAGVEFKMTAGVNSVYAAELTVGLMLSLLRNIQITSENLRAGKWHKDGGVSISGKTVGIVGAGHVGSKVGRITKALGANIIICDIKEKPNLCRELSAVQLTLEKTIERCDILSLHVPLTEITKNLLAKKHLDALAGSYLINTSRAEVLCEDSLIEALKGGLLGAALDVWRNEPYINPVLAQLPNVVGTPHIGGNSKESVDAMGLAAIEGIISYFG